MADLPDDAALARLRDIFTARLSELPTSPSGEPPDFVMSTPPASATTPPAKVYADGGSVVRRRFDPDGDSYDYDTARRAGLGAVIDPDAGLPHWPSREPTTGLLLKGRRHPTFDVGVENDRLKGYGLEMRDGRYYTAPFADTQIQETPLTFLPPPSTNSLLDELFENRYWDGVLPPEPDYDPPRVDISSPNPFDNRDPPLVRFAGGGAVDTLGGFDDYGAGRFTRTPAERREVRERALAQHTPVTDDWIAREFDRLRDTHRFNPLSYGMEAFGRLDRAAGAAREGEHGWTLRDVWDNVLSPDPRFRREYGYPGAAADALSMISFPMTGPVGKAFSWAAPLIYGVGAAAGEALGFAGGGRVLYPALRAAGKIFKGAEGKTHLDVLDQIADPDLRRSIMLDADSRGYIDHRGHFLDRYRAMDYARENDLFDYNEPEWVRRGDELISEALRKPKPEPQPERYDPAEIDALLNALKPEGEGFAGGGKVSRLIKEIGKKYGDFQSRRVERAADETNLDRISMSGLRSLFDPDNPYLFASMPPSEFQTYANPIPRHVAEMVPYPRWDNVPGTKRVPLEEKNQDWYLDRMARLLEERGAYSSPELIVGKQDAIPNITEHEDRHRMLAMDRLGDDRALVALKLYGPRPFDWTERDPYDRVEWLLDRYFPDGRDSPIVPQPERAPYRPRPPIPLGVAPYAGGGKVLPLIERLAGGKPKEVKLPTGEKLPAYPIREFEDIAQKFADRYGNEYPINEFPSFDEARARRIAEAYDVMKHDPLDPRVKRAYDAMIQETLDQYRALEGTGARFEFLRPGEADPYAASPALGYLDLINNGRLKVFPTEQGFGSINYIADNTLLKRVGRIGDLDDATANDAFRVVHDTLGHFGPGNPFFRHQGEERAWNLHSRSYSPDAMPAATSETRGQNSWVNFGPYGARNRSASGADTTYADQKTGLLPEWAYDVDGYAGGGVVNKLGPAFRKWFADSKVVDEHGDPLMVFRGEHGADPGGKFQSRLGSLSFGDKDAANIYSMEPNVRNELPAAPRVTPAYLRIRNPLPAVFDYDDPFLDMRGIEELLGRPEAERIALKFADHIENMGQWQDDFGQHFDSVSDMLRRDPSKLGQQGFDIFHYLDDPAEVDILRRAGIDGAIYGGMGETALTREYRIFDPSQAWSPLSRAPFKSGGKVLKGAKRFLIDPLRESFPGIYKDPDKLVSDAGDMLLRGEIGGGYAGGGAVGGFDLYYTSMLPFKEGGRVNDDMLGYLSMFMDG